MKKGDAITIHLHGHEESVPGEVVEILKDGFLRAHIVDQDHPLASVDGEKRVLTCSSNMYDLYEPRVPPVNVAVPARLKTENIFGEDLEGRKDSIIKLYLRAGWTLVSCSSPQAYMFSIVFRSPDEPITGSPDQGAAS